MHTVFTYVEGFWALKEVSWGNNTMDAPKFKQSIANRV